MSVMNVGLTGYTYSGAGWVLNILIELGIHLEGHLFQHVRNIDNFYSEYRVKENEGRAEKHSLPSLTFKEKFIFRNDINLRYLGHSSFPEDLKDEQIKVIVMVRDPRDAIWSQYNSDTENKAFGEFVEYYCLSQAWSIFYSRWLKYPSILLVPFEGMKKNPFYWMLHILRFLKISATKEQIIEALSNSTSERAREAEMIHISNLPENERAFKNIVNRSGKIEQWKHLPEHQEVFKLIEAHTCELARLFGYLMP